MSRDLSAMRQAFCLCLLSNFAMRVKAAASCFAGPEERSKFADGAKLLAAGLAAVALMHSAPVEAGVIMKKVAVKNLVTGSSGSSESASAVAKPSTKRAPNPPGEINGEFDFKQIALPSALVAIAGGAFVIRLVGGSRFLGTCPCTDGSAHSVPAALTSYHIYFACSPSPMRRGFCPPCETSSLTHLCPMCSWAAARSTLGLQRS